MKTYELTYIISSQNGSEEADKTKNDAEALIQSLEGVILKSEKTVAQTLAYPIKKQSSGYFVISQFQANEDKIKPLKEKLDKVGSILRSFIIVKRPVKEMKERRTRKPLQDAKNSEILSDKDKNRGAKVEMEEINKKLDELLS